MAKASDTITENPNPTPFIIEIYFPFGTPSVLKAL